MRRLGTCVMALLPMLAHAQMSPDSPMVQALRTGHVSVPLPESAGAERVAQKIREHTGSDGAITIVFFLMTRFDTQPRCGRIGFGLFQQTTNTWWGQFGGQINICDDGTAPRRQCTSQAELVAADVRCEDGSQPVDTAEVSAALAKAATGGSPAGAKSNAQARIQRSESESESSK